MTGEKVTVTDNTGTVAPIVDLTTGAPVGTIPAQPPASPATPTIPSFASDDIYAPDGKKWADKFHGSSGALKQVQAEKAEEVGALAQQVASVAEALKTRDAAIAQRDVQLDAMRGQVGNLEELQTQMTTLTEEAARAQRYKLLLQHPGLLALQVEQEVTVEGQETPQKIMVNPAIQLIETSTLPLDQLQQTIALMDAAIGKPAALVPVAPVTDGAIPPAPAPASSNLDTAWKSVQEAQDRLNSGDLTVEAWDAQRKAWAEYRSLQAQLAGA